METTIEGSKKYTGPPSTRKMERPVNRDSVIHLMYFPKWNGDEDLRKRQMMYLQSLPDYNIIIPINKEQLHKQIKILDGQRYVFWTHLDMNAILVAKKFGSETLEDIKRELNLWEYPNFKINLITTGDIRELQKISNDEIIYEKNFVVSQLKLTKEKMPIGLEFKGENICTYEVFMDEEGMPNLQAENALDDKNNPEIEIIGGIEKNPDVQYVLRQKRNHLTFMEKLKAIIRSQIGDKIISNSIKVDPLSAGYSGAAVLKFSIQDENQDQNQAKKEVLLKIHPTIGKLERNKEAIKALMRVGISEKKVFNIARKSTLKKVLGFECIKYEYEEGCETLLEKLEQESLSLQEKGRLIDRVVNEFQDIEEKIYDLEWIELKKDSFWSGQQQPSKYKGLVISQYQYPFFKNSVSSINTKLIGDNILAKDNLTELLSFAFGFNITQPKLNITSVPVARVHGDLHASNILINNKKELFFIDWELFEDTNPYIHAFYDWTKLAVDIEINLFDDGKDDVEIEKSELNDWLESHKLFLDSQEFCESPKFSQIYCLVKLLQEHCLELVPNKDREDENFIKQFHLVRMHHLLYLFCYNSNSDVKRMFIIGAVWQIYDKYIKE